MLSLIQSEYAGYAPVAYTDPTVAKQPVWADIPQAIQDGKVQWNILDGKVDRRSHTGPYAIDPVSHLPLNPVGRTGMTERGLLGRYGPNHAAGCVYVCVCVLDFVCVCVCVCVLSLQ